MRHFMGSVSAQNHHLAYRAPLLTPPQDRTSLADPAISPVRSMRQFRSDRRENCPIDVPDEAVLPS